MAAQQTAKTASVTTFKKKILAEPVLSEKPGFFAALGMTQRKARNDKSVY